MTPTLRQLFDEVHNIPKIPEIIRQLINLLNQPNADLRDISAKVEKEQVIALKVLRLVNSAHFGLSRKISSIDEATTMIGLTQLKTLVIACGLVGSVPEIPNFDLKQFWKDIFLCASNAKYIAEKTGLDAETAYTAGLLSGMGSILIRIKAPKEANEIDQHVKSGKFRPEIERGRLGYTSRAVCAELCRHWKLAPELIAAIEQSAEPRAFTPPNKLACAVYLAEYVGQSRSEGKTADEIVREFPLEIAAEIGFGQHLLGDRIDEMMKIKSNLDGLGD